MTNEEAIKVLDTITDKATLLCCISEDDSNVEIIEAIDMAIETLERIPKLHEDGTLEVSVPSGKGVNRVFVCGDDHWGGLYYPDEE